jgi:hypothetical protein
MPAGQVLPYRAPFQNIDNVLTRGPIVTVSSAELLALNATPKTIVGAPGADRVLVPEFAILHKPAGTAYAGIAAGEDLALRWTDGSGTILMSAEATGFLDQATAQPRLMRAYRAASGVSDITPVANAALVLHMLTGEITTGNSPLYIQVYYRILRALILP